jgi:site-specific DNA-methyltransferase (adenine-specific)
MIEPVIIKNATLYNMDCMELLKATPDKFYDLAIVDPPYGIGENAHRSASRSKAAKTTDWGAFDKNWDRSCPEDEYFLELIRVSKNQVIWGANHMMHKIKLGSPCWLVWDKDNTGCFADCELAYASFSTAVRIFKYRWNGMLQENMKDKEVRIHPTQKPVALYEWLLANYAKPGQRILDTHLGSGSHAIACNNLGFELTACELDKDYFEASVKRINQAAAQERLFA